MYTIKVRSPEGETLELMHTEDETFARGAQSGVTALLKVLERDMDFEEGYTCEVDKAFEPGAAKATWVTEFMRGK